MLRYKYSYIQNVWGLVYLKCYFFFVFLHLFFTQVLFYHYLLLHCCLLHWQIV